MKNVYIGASMLGDGLKAMGDRERLNTFVEEIRGAEWLSEEERELYGDAFAAGKGKEAMMLHDLKNKQSRYNTFEQLMLDPKSHAKYASGEDPNFNKMYELAQSHLDAELAKKKRANRTGVSAGKLKMVSQEIKASGVINELYNEFGDDISKYTLENALPIISKGSGLNEERSSEVTKSALALIHRTAKNFEAPSGKQLQEDDTLPRNAIERSMREAAGNPATYNKTFNMFEDEQKAVVATKMGLRLGGRVGVFQDYANYKMKTKGGGKEGDDNGDWTIQSEDVGVRPEGDKPAKLRPPSSKSKSNVVDTASAFDMDSARTTVDTLVSSLVEGTANLDPQYRMDEARLKNGGLDQLKSILPKIKASGGYTDQVKRNYSTLIDTKNRIDSYLNTKGE